MSENESKTQEIAAGFKSVPDAPGWWAYYPLGRMLHGFEKVCVDDDGSLVLVETGRLLFTIDGQVGEEDGAIWYGPIPSEVQQ